MSNESKAGPPDSGPKQDQNLEGKCILEWTVEQTHAWLQSNYIEVVDALGRISGQDLASLSLAMMEVLELGKKDRAYLFQRISIILRKQQKKKLFEDDDEYESIMEARGTPVQSGNTAAPPPGQETDNLATLRGEVQREETPQQQRSASDFKSSAANGMKWVGYSYDIPWEFDPTKEKLVSQFIPVPIESEEDRAAVSAICNILWNVTISTHDMAPTHEDQRSKNAYSTTVQENHLLRLAKELKGFYRKDILEDARKISMSDIGCDAGVVSTQSKSDGYFVHGDVRYGVYEVKNDHTAPKEGLPQAFGVASNLALKLTKDFGESKPCPVMSGNGRLLQFGVAVLALPTSPFFYTTSKVLDLADPGDRKVAAGYLHCLIKYGSTLDMESGSRSVSSQTLKLEFQPHLAYSKPLRHIFMRHGEGKINESLMDMMRSFTLLWQGQDELKNIVVFPYGIRSPKDDGDSVLVFDNVTRDGYKIGFPPWECREKYLTAMDQAVALLRESKVVHLDLYPSNIFWRQEEDGSMSIKIIDWDASAELGSPLSPETFEALRKSPRFKIVRKLTDQEYYACPEWDRCYLDVLAFASKDKNQYLKLKNNVKEDLDGEFRTLCHKYLETIEKLDINLAKSMSSVAI